MREELKQRQNECSRLRALLATRAKAMDGKVAAESYGGDNKLINEDGELEMAYRTQKDLNR
jgi:myosin-5